MKGRDAWLALILRVVLSVVVFERCMNAIALPMTHSIRILLIDDQTTIRQALQMLLEREPGFEIVGGAADGETGIAFVERLQPDLVLVDIEMPGIDGIETTRIIKERFPKTNILVLTGQDDQSFLQRALQAGAKGYLLKTTPAEDLIYAIRSVQKGYSHMSPGLIEKMMNKTHPATEPQTPTTAHGQQFLDCLQSMQDFNLRCRALQARTQPVLRRGTSLRLRLETLAFYREGFFQWDTQTDQGALSHPGTAPIHNDSDIPTAVELLVA
jgi:DNA-binding NarL/FixJ family response regulator